MRSVGRSSKKRPSHQAREANSIQIRSRPSPRKSQNSVKRCVSCFTQHQVTRTPWLGVPCELLVRFRYPKSLQAHFSQIMINKGMVRMKSDSCAFLKQDHLGHGLLAVTAYVDDLVIAGNAQMVQKFISMIQEEFTLKHVNSSLQRIRLSSWAERSSVSNMATSP